MAKPGELSGHAARRLLAAAFPGLPLERVRRFAAGWDNTAFLINDRWIFRFPRHALADELLRREIEFLAVAAARLPLPVPNYVYVSGPLSDFPYTFAGYQMLPGRPLTAVPGLDVELIAEQLAAFLAALHAFPRCRLPRSIPRFTAASWLERYDALVRATLPSVTMHDAALAAAVRQWWTEYRADPGSVAFQPCPIHGDLAPEHLLLDERGKLSGVVDFGDAMLADPALDLAGLPPALFEAIVRWSRRESAEIELRGAAYRRLAPLHAVAAASSLNRPELLAIGLADLRRRFDPGQRGHGSGVARRRVSTSRESGDRPPKNTA